VPSSMAVGVVDVELPSFSQIAPETAMAPALSVDSTSDENLIVLLDHGGPESVESHRQKSAKNDNALVPTIFWARQPSTNALMTSEKNPLDVLRNNLFLPLWRKRIWRSWANYYKEQIAQEGYAEADQVADKGGAVECLQYAANCTWWEWAGGSKLFFWRWPEPIRHLARDGMPMCIKGELPRYRVPQQKERDPLRREMVADKVGNVLKKGYIGKGKVESLTSYFDVPKGEGDRRMVYDATKCGLNDAIWVPSFSLPDADTLLDIVENCSWMADIDIGEMFLNFPLDKFLQPYCGVDLGPYLLEVVSWLRWLRCAMCLKPSPYVA